MPNDYLRMHQANWKYSAAMAACSQSTGLDLPGKPYQPYTINFPLRTFGHAKPVGRSFQDAWFAKWPWIHYNEGLDAAFCHTCAVAEKEGKLRSSNKGMAFLRKGYCNWKDATESFRKHESSKCRRESVQVMFIIPATTPDVGEIFSNSCPRKPCQETNAFKNH